ncbi:MAG TPA: hypothetical protein VGK92_06365 [Gaiellales bacterium]
MTDETERPRWPATPMSVGDPDAADPPRPSPVPRDDPPAGTPEAPANERPPAEDRSAPEPEREPHRPTQG